MVYTYKDLYSIRHRVSYMLLYNSRSTCCSRLIHAERLLANSKCDKKSLFDSKANKDMSVVNRLYIQALPSCRCHIWLSDCVSRAAAGNTTEVMSGQAAPASLKSAAYPLNWCLVILKLCFKSKQ